MNVVYDHQIFVGQRFGGISRYFMELIPRLRGLATLSSFEVFAPIYQNEYLRKGSLGARGVYVPSVPYLGRACRWTSTMAFRAYAAASSNQSRILHQTYYWEAGRAREYWRGPVVLTIYDMIHEKFPQYFRADDPTTKQKAEAVRGADHVFCISEQTKYDLMEILGVPESKVSVTYLSHSLEAKDFGAAPSSLSTADPYLLYVGPRNGYKNFEALLRAYASDRRLFSDFSVVCLGGGAFSAQELDLVKNLGVPSARLRHLEGGDDLLVSLYRGAAAFVYPSLYEGFGIPPLEAMAMSCPVVCGHGGSLREVVGEAASLFDPAREGALAEAIRSVVYDTSRGADLVRRGHERARLFSWDRCAEKTLEGYRSLL